MFSPQERERVLKALPPEISERSKEEADRIVDNLLAIAEMLHEVWLRDRSKARKTAPPQSLGEGTARASPRK